MNSFTRRILVGLGGAALVGMALLAVSGIKADPGGGSFAYTATTTSVPSYTPPVKASIPPPPVH